MEEWRIAVLIWHKSRVDAKPRSDFMSFSYLLRKPHAHHFRKYLVRNVAHMDVAMKPGSTFLVRLDDDDSYPSRRFMFIPVVRYLL